MWIFKDNCGNVVTNSKFEYTDNRFAFGVVALMASNQQYFIGDFHLEAMSKPVKIGFIFIISDDGTPETWVASIKRFHPDWNIKPYKVIDVEWE